MQEYFCPLILGGWSDLLGSLQTNYVKNVLITRLTTPTKIKAFITSSLTNPLSKPAISSLASTNNAFTYVGEVGLVSINGKDVVVLSGTATNLDVTAVELRCIKRIHMQNDETNALTINNA